MKNYIESLYVHYPFCLSKCHYCGFYSTIYDKKIEYLYLNSLENELKYYFNEYDFSQLKTIYIGGGNPGLNSDFIVEINRILYSIIDLNCILEYTIECNPLNISENFLDNCKKNNINRISIGIQTFSDTSLNFANRTNQSREVLDNAFNLLKEYNFNVSIDLINGLPYSNINKDLCFIKKFLSSYDFINHLSFYDLSIDEGSIFYKNKICGLSEKEKNIYEKELKKLLTLYGLKKYEVSNYSKKGFESIHNKTYWKYENYLGVGPSAHSTIDNLRIENHKDLDRYISGDYGNSFCLSKKEQIEEFLLMGLRLKEGIEIKKINNRFEIDFLNIFQDVVDKYIINKCLMVNKKFIKITNRGEKILNKILLDFFVELDGIIQ